jgi:autotransporter-associated beta strand protein
VNRRRGLTVIYGAVAACAPLLHFTSASAQTTVATSLSSFEGENPPEVIYDPTTQTFSSNPYTNIVDEGNQGNGEVFRFTLRYYPTAQTAWPGYPSTFWDGNLNETSGTDSTDRQRAEVEGLGQYQQIDTTFQYSFSFETDPNFVGTSSFCHIFQLKGLNNSGQDPGYDPVVTLSLGANDKGSLELYSPDGDGDQITIARTFTYATNTWESAVIKITTSPTDGSVMASINGDAMQGVTGVPVDITGLYTYRPKWGFYRGINSNLYNGTNYIQDEDITADALPVPNLTWDNAGASAPTNGTTWDSTNNNWNNGTSAALYSDGSAVTFNDTNNGHYAVTLNTTVNPQSVTVNNSSGNYIISGTGSIGGPGFLTKSGTSTLTIGTANTYSGGTSINSGTVVVNSTTALGAATGALVLGTPVSQVSGTTTPTGSLSMSASVTVGSFSSTTDNATADLLAINSGYTLTDNGAFTVGAINNNTTAIVYNGALTATGGGSLAVTGSGNFNVGQPSNDSGGKDSTTVDLSGLNNVNVNTTATFAVGLGANNSGTLTLANTTAGSIAPANFINAAEIDVGNSQSQNDAGGSTLSLGSGTNMLDASTINVGIGKTGGIVSWTSNATAASSVTIAGTGGSGVANITLGQATSGTYGSGELAQLLLAGHTATVQAGTLAIGDSTGNSSHEPNASVTFDTGTFNVQSVILAADIGGTSTVGPTGSLIIGGGSPNTTAAGVFTVGSSGASGAFDLGDFTNNVSATATASLIINSGVVNMYANINVVNTSASGTTNSTLTLAGNGLLNMEGNAIGSAASRITTVQLAANSTDSATLQNLGGAGINGAGLIMNGSGTLTLLGANTYTGGTKVNSGTLIVGASGALPDGNVSITGGTLQLTLNTGLAQMTSLSITGSGTLDIGNNGIIIDYTTGSDPIASIEQWIKNGFYGLGGPEIISSDITTDDAASGLSYGIGYADGADGVVAGLPSGEIEITYTLLGDANLDGTVNSEDFTPFSHNLGQSGMWDEGDFNYDGTVNSEDFTAFSHNLGQSAVLADMAGVWNAANGIDLANVPEPMSAGIIVMAGLGVLQRRRRSSRCVR